MSYIDIISHLCGYTQKSKYRFRETDMRFYQKYLSDKIVEQSCLLAIPMSMGKTAASLDGARRLLRSGEIKKVLIIAPLRVAVDTWPTEIQDWEHLADLDWGLCWGKPEERKVALDRDPEMLIINRENLQWLYGAVGGLEGWRWDMVVYDESTRLRGFTVYSGGGRDPAKAWTFEHENEDLTYLVEVFKNRKVKIREFRSKLRAFIGKVPKAVLAEIETRARAINSARLEKVGSLTEFGVLYKTRAKVKRFIELSGEPAPSGLLDLGGQAFLLDLGERLGATKTAFINQFFNQSKYSFKVEPLPFAEEMIMSKLKDIMFGLRLEDYIELPPLVQANRFVNLPKKLLEQYRDFEKTMFFDEHEIEAVSRGVLSNKLRQIANGGIYRTREGVENAKRETIDLHDEKLQALESIIEEANGQNILIAYSFDFDLAKLKKKYPKIVVFKDTKNFKDRWNSGEVKLACAHPAEMAHGLNLQFGGHIQVWFGLTWSLELYRQFNARLRRPGQTSAQVWIYHILSRGTADEDVLEALNEKGATQDSINERIRVRLLNPDAITA